MSISGDVPIQPGEADKVSLSGEKRLDALLCPTSKDLPRIPMQSTLNAQEKAILRHNNALYRYMNGTS